MRRVKDDWLEEADNEDINDKQYDLISLQIVEKAALVGNTLPALTGPISSYHLVLRVNMTRVTPAVTLVPCRIWHALVRAG